MNQEQITAMVAQLTGQLQASTKAEEKNLHQLQDAIATALVHQDSSGIRKQDFIFERSDLFSTHNVVGKRLVNLQNSVRDIVKNKKAPSEQVFVRNVPIRSTQILSSVTLESAGARVRTMGFDPEAVFKTFVFPTLFPDVNSLGSVRGPAGLLL